MSDVRNSRRWRERIVPAVLERDGPFCLLRLPGCTGRSETADHIVPVVLRPDLADRLTNLRGSCRHCNLLREAQRKKGVEAAPAPELLLSPRWRFG